MAMQDATIGTDSYLSKLVIFNFQGHAISISKVGHTMQKKNLFLLVGIWASRTQESFALYDLNKPPKASICILGELRNFAAELSPKTPEEVQYKLC